MSEAGDYTATNWVSTHDFTDARKAYADTVVNRGYTKAKAAGVKSVDLVAKNICIENPTLIIVSDVTGSMGKWPNIMFSKLPYLMHELKQYLGEDASILVAAVGDAYTDEYPLQIHAPTNDFEQAKKDFIDLKIEAGGGGQNMESYELAGAFFACGVQVNKNCSKPILVFIGDENPYDRVKGEQLAPFGLQIENQSTKSLFKSLCEIYDVYLIHKPYGEGFDSVLTEEVKKTWAGLLPPEHIVPLSEPERVVDVLFGLLANSTNKIDYFKKELIGRQDPKQVTTVLTSLKTLHAHNTKQLGSGKSTMHKIPSGKTSKPLI